MSVGATHATVPAGAGTPLSDVRAFDLMSREWDELRGRVGKSTPFTAPDWFGALATVAPKDLRLYSVRHGLALEAVAPLHLVNRSLSGLPCVALESLSDDHSQRFDLLAANDGALEQLLDLTLEDPSWDVLILRDVLEHSSADRLAGIAKARGLPTGSWSSSRSPFLPLPADGDALDRALSSKFRANLRRRAKHLEEELGSLSLERIDSEVGLEAALQDGFRLEADGWKGAAQSAILCDPQLTARYRAIAQQAAQNGELSLYFLRAGDRRIAFHFALEKGSIYYLLKPGFDSSLARFGLGHLLVHFVAKDLIARSATELDFLGDEMEWKSEWTTRVRQHEWKFIFRPTVGGKLLRTWKFEVAPRLKAEWDHLHPRAHDGA